MKDNFAKGGLFAPRFHGRGARKDQRHLRDQTMSLQPALKRDVGGTTQDHCHLFQGRREKAVGVEPLPQSLHIPLHLQPVQCLAGGLLAQAGGQGKCLKRQDSAPLSAQLSQDFNPTVECEVFHTSDSSSVFTSATSDSSASP